MDKVFIPRKIKVGFQDRKDTYTGKLAYVIYYDSKGKLRKETSFENWRNNKIDTIEFDNIPTIGFVLNKKAGGYSTGWNYRQTYCRVYDPRDFEFEITIPNLLYILDNVNSIKGKGLDGEFIYGWQGTELLLIPVDAPDYNAIQLFSDTLFERKKLSGSDLIPGATYLNKQNTEVIYLGRFEKWYSSYSKEKTESKGLHYFFVDKDGAYYTYKYPSQGVINTVNEECVANYAELMDKLEYHAEYSPFDHYEYERYTLEELEKHNWLAVYTSYFGSMYDSLILHPHDTPKIYDFGTKRKVDYTLPLDKLHSLLNFSRRIMVLRNGKRKEY